MRDSPATRDGGPRHGAAAQVIAQSDAEPSPPRGQIEYIPAVLVEAIALGAMLVQLPARDPRYIAARIAVEVAEARRADRRAVVDASRAISAAAPWSRIAADHVPHAELARRRAEPGPLASGGAA